MTDKGDRDQTDIHTDDLASIYKRHVQGAFVRSGASVLLWCSGWIAYLIDDIRSENFIGISFTVLFLILFNLPTLWILKHIKNLFVPLRELHAPQIKALNIPFHNALHM